MIEDEEIGRDGAVMIDRDAITMDASTAPHRGPD
jgi:hypothetical protein